MLPRTLEPEWMDDDREASEYDSMDHAEVNRRFVDDLCEHAPLGLDILDLGTGTALIPIELCRRLPEVRVMASDAAVSMLDLARLRLELDSMVRRVQLHHGDAKALSCPDEYFDTVMSNSLVHHIPDPILALREIVRVARPGGLLFVRDLARPDSASEVERLVELHAGSESEFAKQLFRQSLHAALQLAEMRHLATDLGFSKESVQMTSDRHWTWIARKPT
jgi:ubiquinone/menaquinone biosynthesis C-methylase UbiE